VSSIPGPKRIKLALMAFAEAQNLPLPPTLDREDKLRPYLKCEVHVDTPPEESEKKRKANSKDDKLKKLTSPAKGCNPKFGSGARLFFEGMPALNPALSFLRYVHPDLVAS
jgi:hypothetical protein